MVKYRYALGIFALLFILSTASVMAQEEDGSQYYVKSLVITQVALGSNGYKVTYLNGRGRLHNVYLPLEWFGGSAGKGERIDTWASSAPFMQVYYLDGSFSHVRLFLIPSFDHVTWTAMDSEDDTESNFSSEDIVLDFN